MKLRIASRASELALWQANHVAGLLRDLDSGIEVTVATFATRGDRDVDAALPEIGGKGLFTAEIDRALLAGEADLAVHSFKDLPIEPAEGLSVAAIPLRGPVEDVLVSRDGCPLEELPRGARVGTSSPRRAAFLRSRRPDLEIVNLRGNVPTRVRRVTEGELAATLLARAGLERLGLFRKSFQVIGPPALLPAPAQGALAVTVRTADTATAQCVASLDHPPTRSAASAERRVLAGLGGGCSLPLGAFAERQKTDWRVSALLFREKTFERLEFSRSGDAPEELAEEVASALQQRLDSVSEPERASDAERSERGEMAPFQSAPGAGAFRGSSRNPKGKS
jgi:hydroxymethylbilane synthase